MNVLFLALSFSTPFHKSFYEDLLRVFQKNGNHIYVACAKEKRNSEEIGISDSRGITVLRISTGNITGNIGIFEKGISTLTIDLKFKKAIKKYYGDIKFDLILYPTPPITLVNTIKFVKKKTKAKTYLLLKDIFPQNAVDLGMMGTKGVKGLIYRHFRNKEKKLYRISDFIGCMSPANVNYVLSHNREISLDKIEVCPNCLAIPSKIPEFKKINSKIKHRYGIAEGALLFLYGGNLGRPQGIDFLMRCLEKEKDNKKVFFLIIGQGSEYNKLKTFIKTQNLFNAKLLAYMPKEEYQDIADQSDVGMIFLDHRFTIPNYPSRLLNYLASGIPVLLATDSNTDIGIIAKNNGFGFCCNSNDIEGFAIIVDNFIHADREAMGRKGWTFLKENYSVENGYRIIMNHFKS